jgi:methenyltetrahydromethanopterin cyclohydrolase
MKEKSGLTLNERAAALCERMIADRAKLQIESRTADCGATLVDCGIAARGGLEAGRRLAEVCLADLGRVDFVPSAEEFGPGISVMVTTDHPLAACMASQYAGWKIAGGKFFAMGSGPMRAAAGKETLFERIGHFEKSPVAVGVLESHELPSNDVCAAVAADCAVKANKLTLLVAPTSSLAGSVQVVARSVETALHKLFELGFDLSRVVAGCGTVPLPPAAANDLAAIGRTNDAILYGGDVTLWVRGDDAAIETIGPRVPSSASPDHGQPFAAIFEKYNHDFYKIDPLLFSPAMVTFANLDTGHTFRFGQKRPRVIHESFGIR